MFFFLTLPRPPASTLFPYTTLFRSGGAGGLLIAAWGVELLRAFAPDSLPRVAEIRIDGWVLGFTLVLSMIAGVDRKSTRLNSSHLGISYAVFCLKKKKKITD